MEETVFFKNECPTLANVYICVKNLHKDQDDKIESVISLFDTLLEKREKTFDVTDFIDSTEVSVEEYKEMVQCDEEFDDVEFSEMMKTGYFFPHFPIVKKIVPVNITAEKKGCTKNYKKVNKLGAGVIFFYCVEHNTCIGFIILQKAESPKIISQFLLTRFKTMPKVILYDNACNLLEFILNRSPIPFEDTRFYVDAFHYESHINCSNSFNSADHPIITKDLNTSLVEQKNSKLRLLKRTAPYLTFKTFAYKIVYAIMSINKK